MIIGNILSDFEDAFLPPDSVSGTDDPVRFGISHVDAAIPTGIEPESPKMIGFKGMNGSRKTTIMLNIALNQMMSGQLPIGHKIVWWSVETSMTVERLALSLCCMLATRIMVWSYHLNDRRWDHLLDLRNRAVELVNESNKTGRDVYSDMLAIRSEVSRLFGRRIPMGLDIDQVLDIRSGGRKDLVMTHTYIKGCYKYPHRYSMSEAQKFAWELSIPIAWTFPLDVYGPSEHSNPMTRKERSTNTLDMKASAKAWSELAEGCDGNMQLVTDHIMAFDVDVGSGGNRSYELQKAITPIHKALSMEHSMTIWGITQLGVTYDREWRNFGNTKGSDGGDFYERELDQMWMLEYDDRKAPNWIKMYKPAKTRLGTHPDIAIPIEVNSGAIIGDSVLMEMIK